MKRDITLVMGLTGYGKSLWSKLWHRNLKRVLVYDPTATFNTKFYQAEELIAEFEGLNQDEWIGTEKEFNAGVLLPEDAGRVGGLSFVLQNNTLILEELATLFDKGQRTLPDWARRLVFFGRHHACSIVLIAQRPAYIPIDFRSQANRVISFTQHEGDDLDWLQDFYGKERVKQLPYLPKFHCFDYCNTQVYFYSIEELVEKHLKIKLDKQPEYDNMLMT